MRALSKSKLVAFRQCPKRLWLEVHRPELREDSQATVASFNAGHQVGEVAQAIYDPEGNGELIDIAKEGFGAAFARTEKLIKTPQPIFEAGFQIPGALAFADVLLPQGDGDPLQWRMVEVKSSTSVKDYHRDDTAIQSYIARQSGVPLTAVALAHIDSSWVYPGGGDYRGLLVENDLTDEAFARTDEVREWIDSAQSVVAKKNPPDITTGPQCSAPFACGFIGHCSAGMAVAKHSVEWFPGNWSAALRSHVDQHQVTEMRDVPEELLNAKQRRIRQATLSGKAFFDKAGAAKELSKYPLPAYFMDFETINFPAPIWKGTRPFQQIPFQYSVHHLKSPNALSKRLFWISQEMTRPRPSPVR